MTRTDIINEINKLKENDLIHIAQALFEIEFEEEINQLTQNLSHENITNFYRKHGELALSVTAELVLLKPRNEWKKD